MAGWDSVKRELLTFDDVVILPGLAPVDPSDVDLSSRVTRSIEVSIPLVSSPMDTVTEWRMATVLARLGSVGVIHRNMSLEEQIGNVRRVKSQSPSPWSEVPRVDESEPIENVELRLLETGAAAAAVFKGSRFRGVFIMAGHDAGFWGGKASALVQLLLLLKPLPTIDGEGRLRVGAAISPFDVDRARALEKAGADFLVTDVAHLHNREALRSLAKLAKEVSIDVVAGNLGTKQGVLDTLAVAENVAGLRVGISSGSICSTGEVTGASMPTLSAVMDAFEALRELGAEEKVPIIADGGVRNAGDAAKALIAGASAVMVGRLLAGTEEAPAPRVSLGGRLYKPYRGMASRGAMERRYSVDRYTRNAKIVEEGVEGLVPYKGSAVEVLLEFVGGLQAALGYAGVASVREAWSASLARVTAQGLGEVRPHDVILG